LRERIAGIGPDDPVIVWGGGIYDWFDPLTLLRAVDRLRRRIPDVRLVFMGLTHPNPNVPSMRMPAATRELADQLGLTHRHVFFNDGWVPYAERQNFLLDADVGVSTHFVHVETAFAFRTRILDYLWTSLPIVSTGGDALADLIDRRGLGLTVEAEDVEGLEAALHRLLTDVELAASCRRNLTVVAPEYRWTQVLEPLVRFCDAPARAPDHDQAVLADAFERVRAAAAIEQVGRRQDVLLAARHLRRGGPRLLARKVVSRLRHMAAGRR
jgi:glycosyltransferase involved in cell wall biosynthesis